MAPDLLKHTTRRRVVRAVVGALIAVLPVAPCSAGPSPFQSSDAQCDQKAARAAQAVPAESAQGRSDDPTFQSHLRELVMREPHVSSADRRIYYNDSQFGDLRLPNGPGPYPVAILIHGGAWTAGTALHYFAPLADFLTCLGVATWNIEYGRLGAGGGWPVTFKDVGAAADFLRLLATSYRLDLTRSIAIGHSAGGHLSLWLAGRHRLSSDAELYTPNPLLLRGVLNLDGPTDLANWPVAHDTIIQLLGGGPAAQIAHRMKEASPVELLPLGVPQVILGSETARLPLIQSYATAANGLGDKVQVIVVARGGHFDTMDPLHPQAGPAIRKAALSLLGVKAPSDNNGR